MVINKKEPFAVANATQRSCHKLNYKKRKNKITMEMKYRLNQERLLAEHKLNKEILIHSLARLNQNINKLYGCIVKKQVELQKYDSSSSYGLLIKEEIDDYTNELNRLKNKRKPILDLVMSAYRLSLDEVKQLIKQADKEKLPTYKTIDYIINMIETFDYSFE